jgi:hypothetical protein
LRNGYQNRIAESKRKGRTNERKRVQKEWNNQKEEEITKRMEEPKNIAESKRNGRTKEKS